MLRQVVINVDQMPRPTKDTRREFVSICKFLGLLLPRSQFGFAGVPPLNYVLRFAVRNTQICRDRSRPNPIGDAEVEGFCRLSFVREALFDVLDLEGLF